MMSFWLSMRNSPSFQSPRPPAVLMLPQSGLARTSDDLLKRPIRYQEPFQQARLQRIGAAELERRRYTVRFRISGIKRHQLRENFVGQSRHRIETGVGVTGAEIGAGAEQVGHVDCGEVVTAPCG